MHGRIGKNFAWELDLLRFHKRWSKNYLTFFSVDSDITYGEVDHAPSFHFSIILFNVTLIEVNWYNVHHVEEDSVFDEYDEFCGEDYVFIGLRPQVAYFANEMEKRMRVGDERGWTMDGLKQNPASGFDQLTSRAKKNLGDAQIAQSNGDIDKAHECLADASNLAMLADGLYPRGKNHV